MKLLGILLFLITVWLFKLILAAAIGAKRAWREAKIQAGTDRSNIKNTYRTPIGSSSNHADPDWLEACVDEALHLLDWSIEAAILEGNLQESFGGFRAKKCAFENVMIFSAGLLPPLLNAKRAYSNSVAPNSRRDYEALFNMLSIKYSLTIAFLDPSEFGDEPFDFDSYMRLVNSSRSSKAYLAGQKMSEARVRSFRMGAEEYIQGVSLLSDVIRDECRN